MSVTARGFVANFVQKVMTGQLPLSVRRLGSERIELFGRSEALFPSLNHHLFFPDHSILKFFSLAIRAVLIFQVLHSIRATHNHSVAFS